MFLQNGGVVARALGGRGEKRILGASQGSLRIFVSEAKQKAQ